MAMMHFSRPAIASPTRGTLLSQPKIFGAARREKYSMLVEESIATHVVTRLHSWHVASRYVQARTLQRSMTIWVAVQELK